MPFSDGEIQFFRKKAVTAEFVPISLVGWPM
jgi:hypothetical protein